ncbi:MAG: TIGR03936 family radical SAM-associated protein [Candidatus Nanopelagicales bacterium]|nr:TIGR03936 family radical SAM-associated protein [Actinomycetes bacterium]MCH9738242.1 TIGR03936 family radical SAM-associated protein [Actinomycetes bacterium]MCH9831527.1 TIGR03936 family radical SAM-associated protein [Actinomycetes bacterium]
MANKPPERDLAPVIQKLRLRYAKRGRLRFSSHRDFQRALERALRRAGVPMAYSAGFSPHPKISYSNSAPTGVASEAEYVEIGVTELCDPQKLQAELDAALPPGLDVVEVIEATSSDFSSRLEASLWEMEICAPAQEVMSAVGALMESTEVLVERKTKSGLRVFDARSAILLMESVTESAVTGPGGDQMPPECVILHVVVRHITPSVRPDDVLTALKQVGNLVPLKPIRVTRLAQGPLNEVGDVGIEAEISIRDPFDPDRVLV